MMSLRDAVRIEARALRRYKRMDAPRCWRPFNPHSTTLWVAYRKAMRQSDAVRERLGLVRGMPF